VKPGPEKRKIPRCDFPQPIHFNLTREISGNLKLLEGISRGIDISSHGLGILTDLSLQRGDVLKVLIPARAENAIMPVFSRVAWAKKENNEFRVGLEFLA
jgi:hypothetical protein